MRFTHTADIHLGRRQYNLKQRATDTRLTFQYVLTQAEQAETDAVLIPGDLFDSRDIEPQTLKRTEELLEPIEQPVIVSPGNHDQNMSRRRDLTWLEYLNDRGLITLVAADLTGSKATFAPTSVDDPREGGGGYVDFESDGELVRVFGLQYRGAYIDRELPQVVEAIETVNDSEETPDTSILLAHFGVDDAVPDLGANVARAELTDLEAVVDYLALGHIHKQYETGAVGYNPGSPEALDIQEGRWEDGHGYYIYDTETDRAEHHLSKRRPYHTLTFDVTGYRTFEDLRSDLEDDLESETAAVERTCDREIHRTGSGDRRAPIVNLRLEGTLQLGHTTFDVEALTELVAERLNALYVQPTNHTERKAVKELLGDLDRDEAFDPDGTVNTEVLQRRVFETLAGESQYSGPDEAVADTLTQVEELVNEDAQGVSTVADFLQDKRRQLFPDGPRQDDADEDTAEVSQE